MLEVLPLILHISEVRSAKSGSVMNILGLSIGWLILRIRELLLSIAVTCTLALVFDRGSCSSRRSLNQINDRFLDNIINLLSNLEYLVLSV